MRRRWGRWAGMSVAGAALAAGCTFPASPNKAVTVLDSAHGAISGIPSSLPGGQYSFTLRPAAPSGGVQLVRLATGYTQGQFFSDIGLAFGNPSTPGFKTATERLYANAHFVGGVNGPSSFSTYLIPGKYLAVDANAQSGTPESFTVTPRAVGPNYPHANVAIGGYMSMTGGHDSFGWAVLGALGRSGVLHFTVLDGDEPHFVDLAKLTPGHTAQQCFSFSGSGANPNCTDVLATGVLSTHETMTMPYTLPGGGDYAIACFVTNPDTGQPHAMLGMIRTLHVS